MGMYQVDGPLDAQLQRWVMEVLTRNMKLIYFKSGMKWSSRQKLKDMLDESSKFIFVWKDRPNETTTGLQGRPGCLDLDVRLAPPIAYCMYRLVSETKDEHSLYLYELHVVPQHQGSGIGRQLMQHLEAIAKLKHMPKIMLTVQIANVNAMHFYRKLGFSVDPICPSNYAATASCSYKILSKAIDSENN